MSRRITRIINHWSVTPATSTVEDIRRIHIMRGFRDIGYHRIILHPSSHEFKDPYYATEWWQLVKLGRSLDDDLFLEWDEVGAHALGYNSDSIGVCTIGKPGRALHPLQREAIVMTNKILLARYELTPVCVVGHQEVNPTECPGPEIMNLIKQIRNKEV